MATDNNYPCIAAWCKMMGSYGYYIENQIAKARADNAPQDAIYEKNDGGWARLAHVTNHSTQWYFQQNHPDLVERFTNWGKVAER